MTATTITEHRRRTRPLRDLELDVLESIYTHRLLTTVQLRQLHTPAGETRGLRWMQRVTAHLHRRGLLDWVRHRDQPRLNCWYTTGEGADVIDAAGAGRAGRRVLLTPESAGGMLQRHTLAVNDTGIAFSRWARRHGHDCDHRSWRHEVAHRVADGPAGGELLVADAVLHYAVHAKGRTTLVYRFIELDRATMTVQQLGEKLRGYVRYAGYRPRHPDEASLGWRRRYPGLPGVVVVLDGKPRPVLERRAAMLAAMARVDPLLRDAEAPTIVMCLLEDLQEHGPFAGVFRCIQAPRETVDLLGRERPAPLAETLDATGTDG
jgi:hypothetical protein